MQTQTSSRDPKNLSLRRAVLGPKCYLTSDGKPDLDPIHYWHQTLSDKLNAPKVLPVLHFELDESQNLDSLLLAHMPGNLDQFVSVAAMIISSSNSDSVRFAAKHHPCVSYNKNVLTVNLCCIFSWL